MSAFRPFEIQAISLMAGESLTQAHLSLLRSIEQPSSYEYTGCGYFLSVRHPLLPACSRTLSEPAVVGNAGDVQAGFVVFLKENELTLECHTWGAVDVPANFRELQILVSTPPMNFADLRNAT